MTDNDAFHENASYRAFYAASRAKRQALQAERGLETVSSDILRFDSNDYFGLRNDKRVIAAGRKAAEEYGAGTGASRIAGGYDALTEETERFFAGYYGFPDCLILGSGYLANSAALPALCGEGDIILADKLMHACIIDGARLSGAKLFRFRHNDVSHAETLLKKHRSTYAKCLIVTETIFSMDGDAAPLADLRALSDRYDAALYADHAHGTGFIPESALCVDILSGTFSKGLGSYGGFLCVSADAKTHLINTARGYMFSTGLPAFCTASAAEAARILQTEPERIAAARAHAKTFARVTGCADASSVAGAIVPYHIGANADALEKERQAREAGIIIRAIRPPTVPPGTARLRAAFSSAHTQADIEALCAAIA